MIPLATDYVFPRESRLLCTAMCGSVAEFDSRVSDCDSIVMIEVIEHLYANELGRFPDVVFGQIHPRVVAITTPNSEYNVVFPNFSGFRHDDHKFEWTRKEFRDWCERVASVYGYSVEYSGVGDPPAEFPDVGFCSQACFFHAKEFRQPLPDTTPYREIARIDRPFKSVSPTQELIDALFAEVNSTKQWYRQDLESGRLEPSDEASPQHSDVDHPICHVIEGGDVLLVPHALLTQSARIRSLFSRHVRAVETAKRRAAHPGTGDSKGAPGGQGSSVDCIVEGSTGVTCLLPCNPRELVIGNNLFSTSRRNEDICNTDTEWCDADLLSFVLETLSEFRTCGNSFRVLLNEDHTSSEAWTSDSSEPDGECNEEENHNTVGQFGGDCCWNGDPSNVVTDESAAPKSVDDWLPPSKTDSASQFCDQFIDAMDDKTSFFVAVPDLCPWEFGCQPAPPCDAYSITRHKFVDFPNEMY